LQEILRRLVDPFRDLQIGFADAVEQFGKIPFTVESAMNNSLSGMRGGSKPPTGSDLHEFTRVLAFFAGLITSAEDSLPSAEAHYATVSYSDTVKL
jgi:hypothetical protein